MVFYSDEHYVQPKNAPPIGYEAGLLAHTTIVGGGVKDLGKTLRVAVVRF